jgi:aminoglycoside phosphotransferase (APT) family kinase protein
VSRLVGIGRSAEVYEHGAGQVLRRYREPRDTEREVAAMEHARAHGFPVPGARALSDTDIVMDRVTGATMLDDLVRRPWRMAAHAAILARLHQQLHAIPAPAWLPEPVGSGRSLLHLDLHPDNVMLSPGGPVVIDWPNAARGPGQADVAHTWLVLACSLPVDEGLRQRLSLYGRQTFLWLFLRHFRRSEIEPFLPVAGPYRLANRGLPDDERRLIAALSAKGP